MELKHAAHTRKSSVSTALPLLLMFLLLATAAASASASPSAISHQPNDLEDFATCFRASSCYDTGCAIRCRDLGLNPAGSRCKVLPGIGQCCCCGRLPPPASSSSPVFPSIVA
ncbi:hypothetical protein OsJ_33225 [Oryza sativa Japonica Group]|uniref:Uncharacterized protein n=4 Tax=Oryza TaxID=4527 RepID=A3C9C0_ORYSJ|nr:hypothetical protein LOC_Os11g08280 [Oryza sativa Japonica Group]ABA91773.1 hypothetical protein LOC_Os11g08280 [Oryza sativa Japonica Group]EAZ17683.1 hypothetical protein OsJ_33225 [Oryza sativa Japonica Group]KAF2909861.1 hypothetical protein DAI22_11g058300 [Oryza sativa Japonica Group]